MFLCRRICNKINIEMKDFVKYLGLALILIGAVLVILCFVQEWNNDNLVNFGSFGLTIVGLITYIVGVKYVK